MIDKITFNIPGLRSEAIQAAVDKAAELVAAADDPSTAEVQEAARIVAQSSGLPQEVVYLYNGPGGTSFDTGIIIDGKLNLRHRTSVPAPNDPSPGWLTGGDSRRVSGLLFGGVSRVVTTLGIFGFDDASILLRDLQRDAESPDHVADEIDAHRVRTLTTLRNIRDAAMPKEAG